MIYFDKGENDYLICECPKCFYRWEQKREKGDYRDTSLYCEYCFDHLDMDDLSLLKRRLEVMEYIEHYRLPELLRSMFDYIMKRIDEKPADKQKEIL